MLVNARGLIILLPLALLMLAAACGGDSTIVAEDDEFSETLPSGAGRALEEREGSGTGENQTAAMMTMVDGVKQWDGPPKGLSGGLLIVYKDEFKATVEMETVGGEPADGQKIVFYMYHSDFPFFRNGDVTFAVNNFVFLTRQGFYDGLTFHRVVPGELVQTGDPPGPLDGAGYTFNNETTVKIEHDRPGIVSLANNGIVDGKGTNSSQWFITLKPLPEFNTYDEDLYEKDCAPPGTPCHTPFGIVSEGMEVVESIIEGDKIKTVTVEKLEPKTSKFNDLNR